jgi:hypothetical protein
MNISPGNIVLKPAKAADGHLHGVPKHPGHGEKHGGIAEAFAALFDKASQDATITDASGGAAKDAEADAAQRRTSGRHRPHGDHPRRMRSEMDATADIAPVSAGTESIAAAAAARTTPVQAKPAEAVLSAGLPARTAPKLQSDMLAGDAHLADAIGGQQGPAQPEPLRTPGQQFACRTRVARFAGNWRALSCWSCPEEEAWRFRAADRVAACRLNPLGPAGRRQASPVSAWV